MKDNNKFKNKITRTARKSKPYGSLTTKELKKKHSSRLVGGVEMSSRGREDMWQGSSWRTRASEAVAGREGVPHLQVDKPAGTTGE